MPLDFQIGAGSVAGTEHRQGIPTNCQDALCVDESRHGVIIVVADGCGSSAHSEVGANIAVQLVSSYLQQYLAQGYKPGSILLERVRQLVVGQLTVLAKDMGRSLSQVVNDYFLFTLCGAVINEATAVFFALGDGVIIINGETIVLETEGDKEADNDPSLTNAPVYLTYAITGSKLTDDDPSKLQFQIVREMPTAELKHALIGSDGVEHAIAKADRNLPGTDEPFGPVSQFWKEPRFTRPGNGAITRRLNLMARDQHRTTDTGRVAKDSGLLPDDITVVVIRRPPAPEPVPEPSPEE